MLDFEEDDDFYQALYDNGRWFWDDTAKGLIFVSNAEIAPVTKSSMSLVQKQPIGEIQFREEIDLVEQMRYRRNCQRKIQPGEPNIVTLQDIKDLVIYSAPVELITMRMINMLHKSTTDRFLRALILYCAYSFQVQDEMKARDQELHSKVRTVLSETLEEEFRDNLCDIRVLVAKEYCTILVGAGDMKPFHHMGLHKNQKSKLLKDAHIFETFLRIAVQVVYVALARKQFKEIEVEIHRLMKSESFNTVERKLQFEKGVDSIHHPRDGHSKNVVMGNCLRSDKTISAHSPLMNEVFCERPIDYRMRGLGVVKYPKLNTRLRYFMLAIACPEEEMAEEDIILGIIGMPRSRFDVVLALLPETAPVNTKSRGAFQSTQAVGSKGSGVKGTKSSSSRKPYPDIVIPPKEEVETTPPKGFVEVTHDVTRVNLIQFKLWRSRLSKIRTLLKQRKSLCRVQSERL